MSRQAPRLLVTGSSGLIGSAVAAAYARDGWAVTGVESHQRAVWFGVDGDTRPTTAWLQTLPGFRHLEVDVRERGALAVVVSQILPDVVVHTAAQPSHDKAAEIPYDDFDTNAVGTLNLLEAVRTYVPEAVVVHLSTNKVYGDAPNERPVTEYETRLDYADPADWHGIAETCRVDASLHSLFGASKLAADILMQEYGRYFGIRTTSLRAGCLTGPRHAGVPLHGFFAHLVATHKRRGTYAVIGYGGKQLRDVLHADDVVAAIQAIVAHPPEPGAVFNLGGGRQNSVSVREAIEYLEDISGRLVLTTPPIDTPRRGDHRCYLSDTRKFRAAYPAWRVTRSVPAMLEELWADQ